MSDARPLALVTGGCRRLGAAIAARLATGGFDLALHAAHDDRIEPALARAIEAGAVRSATFIADFAQEGAADALFAAVLARFGRAPALVVNSAAIFEEDALETADGVAIARHMAVNVSGPLALMRAAARAAGEHECAVVNILDQRLAHLHVDQLSYSLSKAALAALSEVADQSPGLRVNAVAPGLAIPTGDYDAAQIARLAQLMPLGRLPRPGDVAEAVWFLATHDFLRGQIFYVDGGAHLVAYPRDFVHLALAEA